MARMLIMNNTDQDGQPVIGSAGPVNIPRVAFVSQLPDPKMSRLPL